MSCSLQIANHTGQAEYEPVFDIDLLGEGEGEDHPFDVAVEQANAQHESVAYFDAETGCVGCFSAFLRRVCNLVTGWGLSLPTSSC